MAALCSLRLSVVRVAEVLYQKTRPSARVPFAEGRGTLALGRMGMAEVVFEARMPCAAGVFGG